MKMFPKLILVVLAAFAVAGCGEKKKSDDIIVKKVEEPKPQGPIRMQEYKQTKDIQWLGRDYQVEILRIPDDSLQMVQDETGQKFVDNRISLRIFRSDGSVFLSRSFTKAAFEKYLDDDYRKTGITEGFVFDRVDGNLLYFAASVCHPQTDEYIPLVITVNNLGELGIKLDEDMDTYGSEEEQKSDQ
ncbi:MAG: DUF4738 domain-containing protein [Prevotella sp.]|nr:DUF4738 domain-containing protein [Prevotella sp.]